MTHALVFIPNQREIKADLSSTEVQAKSCHKYACQFIWRQFPVNRERYSTFQPQYNQSCGLGLSNCKALGEGTGARAGAPQRPRPRCARPNLRLSGLLISPFLTPQLQTRPASSRACGPQALRQAAAPRRREAPERAPASALRTRARERLRERGARQAVYAEHRGRGLARAWEPPALRFPVAAEIGVGDPKKACAREALARCTEKDLATRSQSSRSPPPPQSGGLCSPALDRP